MSSCHLSFAWLARLVLIYSCVATGSVTTLDKLSPTAQHARSLPTHHLSANLELYVSILTKHNARLESHILQQYIEQLRAVLPRGCCDYYTALPIIKRLTEALTEVVDVRLPSTLRPVVRRSYISAVWLLQRSKYFKWNMQALHKPALSGFYKLYEDHMDAAAGKPISFHHISKTGGTSLCSVAAENGCKGPSMSKSENCLMDPGLDGPIWVLRHDVAAANNLTAVKPSSPSPRPLPRAKPVLFNDAFADSRRLAKLTNRVLKKRNFDWFMYDCPAQQLTGKIGRSCSERQEAALSKSATFFACENVLPTAHGTPQVCDAFTNVILVREAVSAAISLMTEVSLVYVRLLKRYRILGWEPPKWDLTWWQQWAPVVLNDYSTRTLLGPNAYCPAEPAADTALTSAAARAAAATGSAAAPHGRTLNSRTGAHDGSIGTASSSNNNNSTSHSSYLGGLSPDQVQVALEVLASFDVVLDLRSDDLINVSVAKLLGWSGFSFSDAKRQRPAPQLQVPSWAQLDLFARQKLPEPKLHDSGSVNYQQQLTTEQDHDTAATDSDPQQQQGSAAAPATAAAGPSVDGSNVAAGGTELSEAVLMDAVRRLLGEVRVRQVYAQHGLPAVLVPLNSEMHLPTPPAGAVDAALAALMTLNQSRVVIQKVTDEPGGDHLLVKVFHTHKATANGTANITASSTAAGAAAAEEAGADVYRVWPRHGVLLKPAQYQQLLQSTAVDSLLHQHGAVMQLLDAAWVSMLMQQRKVRKMLHQVEEEVQAACGFAGLNHEQ